MICRLFYIYCKCYNIMYGTDKRNGNENGMLNINLY